jgi:hypothetical protein
MALIAVTVLLVGLGGGWVARGQMAPRVDVIEGWAYASGDGTQIACCADSPGGEGASYSTSPAWYDATDERHPVNRSCMGGPAMSSRVRMGVVDSGSGKAFKTIVWAECLSLPEPIQIGRP